MTDAHPDTRRPAIADHALIGDCRSAALVSRDGAVDWLCWPRFDSPSLLAALLDPDRGGHWTIAPASRYDVERRYVGASAVLETRFTTEAGVLVLHDFMPVAAELEKSAELWPEHQLLRRAECTQGSVQVHTEFAPRPDYARRRPRLRDRGKSGIVLDLGAEVAAFRSELPVHAGDDTASGTVRLHAGDVRWSSLTFATRVPAYFAPLGETAERRLRGTLDWWSGWSRSVTCGGPHRDMILRSAITLKLLTYAPTGAVIAAPTTSLPESIGDGRNWDYRYCWLRDAAMTVRAFQALGLRDEADAFASWILHATRLSWPEVRIMYDVYGNPPRAESELGHLAGYRDSRPVRIGNGARDQFQLDVYGEVVNAVLEYACGGGAPDRSTRRFLRGIARTVSRRWEEPDHGIWEVRGSRRHHTWSRVRSWSALDQLLELDARWRLRLPRASIAAERDRIRDVVERDGWNASLGTYVATSNGSDVDASLLLMAEHGFTAGESPRFVATVRAIEERLADGALVYRYRERDGLPGVEGAFGICSFWRVLALLAIGDRDQAEREFERLLAFANEVGLYAEEIDVHTGEPLGNFPQAFTHVGLINAAIALRDAGDARP